MNEANETKLVDAATSDLFDQQLHLRNVFRPFHFYSVLDIDFGSLRNDQVVAVDIERRLHHKLLIFVDCE